MNQKGLLQYALEQFGSEPVYLWEKYPEYCVLRHSNGGKWYALMASVPKSKLGLTDADRVEILNIKCDPILLDSLLQKDGFFPAYHMNKTHWVTILLDGTVSAEEICGLLQMSYDMTRKKPKKAAMADEKAGVHKNETKGKKGRLV